MRAGRLIAGRYRLQEQVGRGGNGMVWRALDEELGRVVAVKRALPGDDARAALLRREARILARTNHPNVVTLYDLVADGGEWWLAMEYVPARSLAAYGRLPPEQAAAIGAQIARALRAVHATGVLHRDVKPGNVLLTEEGNVKLGDFGVSRSPDSGGTLTGGGVVIGTPAFVAPEVARGQGCTAASDVFSLGATLYTAIEGESPYGPSHRPVVLLYRASKGQIGVPSRAGRLAPVLAALMHPDPAARPTAAQAERMLLEAVHAELRPFPEPPADRLRWRRLAMVALGVAAAVAATTWVVARVHRHPPPAGLPAAVGDPRTADPCALADPGPLSRFGRAALEPRLGGFNRCDVIVRTGDAEVDVRVELLAPRPSPHRASPDGTLRVIRSPADGATACARTLLLTDGHRVRITASTPGDPTPEGHATGWTGGRSGHRSAERDPGLCAMADAVVDTAVGALAQGELPRRAPEPGSLAQADACALLGASDLARFPGADTLHPERGFAGWQCRWPSVTRRASLLVRFDREERLTAAHGRRTPLAVPGRGREPGRAAERVGVRVAYVRGEGGACLARVPHRHTLDGDGRPVVELLTVAVSGEVGGPDPSGRRCLLATALAAPAAARLPDPTPRP
ncbi:serine/threonine-protein kinase [Nonomuraea pusilla]|uniref:serine/threonine-protein kinase n=1 Tax=Nonomuraea pusilla TaxID=46177 RepID=UPI00332D8EE5